MAKSNVNTRNTRDGMQTVLSNVEINFVKVATAVPSYNGGKPQFELQIATDNKRKAMQWKAVMPNLTVQEDGSAKFTLKRPAFQGRPNVVDAEGMIVSEEVRKSIGNGTIADVRISHREHKGFNYVQLEAIRINELVTFDPTEVMNDSDFDF